MSGRKRRSWLFAVSAAAVVALPASLTPALATTAGHSGWVATGTLAEPIVAGADLIGLASPTMPMSVAVALNLRNRSILERVVKDRTTISGTQFASDFAPTAAADHAVASYLSREGLRNVQIDPGGLLVTADATAAEVESAFHTRLDDYTIAGRSAFANTLPASIPAALAPFVGSVLGLQDVVTMTLAPQRAATAARVVAAGTPDPSNVGSLYGPPQMWKFYDAPKSVPTGRTTPIAIFAEGNLSTTLSQFAAMENFYKKDGMATNTPVSVVPVGPASPDTAGDVEWRIDTENSVGMAGGVSKLVIYDATNLTDIETTREFVEFADSGEGVRGAPPFAKAASASFGECEYQAYLDGSMLASDEAFLEAAAQGQTVFASSGDQGGFCPYANTNGIGPGGPPGVSYPTSSPYVISVGGTTLLSNTDYSYNTETAWYTSGGGTSIFESAPYWQAGVIPPSNTVCGEQFALNCGRAVPDVAMDADGNVSPGIYFSGGQPNSQGGTSLASPLALGTWARLESAHHNQLSFAGPLLYGAYGSPGFHDIILGNSGPYPALPGWDYATGMGSFDVAQMVSAIVPPPPPVQHISGWATFYLHGQSPVDETNSIPIASSTYETMDTTAPTGSTPDSHEITSYVAGPNTDCAGNNFFPIWMGKLHGRITGPVTVTIDTVSSPAASVEVQLFSDVDGQACGGGVTGSGGSAPIPIGEATIALPPGPGTVAVTFKNVNALVDHSLMLQVLPTNSGPNNTVEPMVARALYNATGYASSMKLYCRPNRGTTSC